MISSVLAGGLCRSPALWVDLICVGGWLMSLASTVGSLLAVTTPAPLYNTVLAGANCVRQHANFHVSAQNISGLVAGAAMPSSFTEEPRSSGLGGPGDNLWWYTLMRSCLRRIKREYIRCGTFAMQEYGSGRYTDVFVFYGVRIRIKVLNLLGVESITITGLRFQSCKINEMIFRLEYDWVESRSDWLSSDGEMIM
jgi:hypothetical protein